MVVNGDSVKPLAVAGRRHKDQPKIVSPFVERQMFCNALFVIGKLTAVGMFGEPPLLIPKPPLDHPELLCDHLDLSQTVFEILASTRFGVGYLGWCELLRTPCSEHRVSVASMASYRCSQDSHLFTPFW